MELLKEFDKTRVLEKQRTTTQTTLEQIDLVLAEVRRAQAAVAAAEAAPGDAAAAAALASAAGRVGGTARRTQAAALAGAKELHGAAARFAKAVDRERRLGASSSLSSSLSSSASAAVLARAVVLHLVREGRFDLARSFAEESGTALLAGDAAAQAQFADMFAALAALRRFDVGPAAAWASANADALRAAASPLAFALARLQFLKLLFGAPGAEPTAGSRELALAYAQLHFKPFHADHSKDIQKLLCALLFAKNIAASPYKDIYASTIWSDAARLFTRDFCLLLHLPAESPLETCVSVGVNALPTIIKMSSILKEQRGLEWSTEGELPVEIPLLDRQRFHSVFACPVSKELGTAENPPMMMICGHVVCKESLLRLGKGNPATKFKCPYCPSEGKAEQAIQIYF